MSGADDSKSATQSPEPDETLLNVRIPTNLQKSQKRKQIRIEFDDNGLDESILHAQRLEKERLERLEKIRSTQRENDHITEMERLLTVPQSIPGPSHMHNYGNVNEISRVIPVEQEKNDMFDMYVKSASSSNEPPHEVITLSSDDEEEPVAIPVNNNIRGYGITRRRYAIPTERDRDDEAQMKVQLDFEKSRRLKVRNEKDLESTEKLGGRLLVNAGHPPEDADVFVATHLTHVLQPHQLGGIRFMYDNVVESLSTFNQSPGFGCILAHSMGLGKTIQVITLTEIFLRTTSSRKVLILMPINVIQNWFAEFERWLPKFSDNGDILRTFDIFLLGDAVKTFDQRVNMIEEWHSKGGVLLMGYDLFRLLLKSTMPPKERKKRPKLNLNGVSAINSAIREESREDEMDFDAGFTNNGRAVVEAHSIIKEALLDPGPELVVCDEGHKIKNLTSEISMALNNIRTRRRIVLTGYPLQNNLMEYFCMIDFVRPKILGNKKVFSERFEKPIKNGQCTDSTLSDIKFAQQRTHVLIELVKGFVQRRTHHLLKSILPENREFVIMIHKSNIQRLLYKNFVLFVTMEMRKTKSGFFNPLKAFAACSKIWNHPDVLWKFMQREKTEENGAVMQLNPFLYPTNYNDPFNTPSSLNGYCTPGPSNTNGKSPTKKRKRPRANTKSAASGDDIFDELEKAEKNISYEWAKDVMEHYNSGVLENGLKMVIAMAILDECTRLGEKILIFSQNLTALDVFEDFLSKRRIVTKEGLSDEWMRNKNYYRFDGSTSGSDREKLIKRFNSDPNLRLFLISTRAGSLGINLVSASRCIILDACWNPCHDAQAVCRIYRYGQTRRTFIYRLIMDNSMEKAIFNRQISKHGLQQRVVDEAQVDANITQKELENLLVYNESFDVSPPKLDPESWEFDDEVLKTISRSYGGMFSEKPFLHESLIMESERVLSEEEKREAELLYEMENRGVSTSYGMMGQYEPVIETPRYDPPAFQMPPRTMAMYPHHLNRQLIFADNQMMSLLTRIEMAQRNPPDDLVVCRVVPTIPPDHPMYAKMLSQVNRKDHVVFGTSVGGFPGAMNHGLLHWNKSGFFQDIITDRDFILPVIGDGRYLYPLPMGTPVVLVKPQEGLFLRVSDFILNASNTVYEYYSEDVTKARANIVPECVTIDD
ncbi:unnamed protein product [Caenorhabditis bovis]|uniref:Uncharacterized protein n=1 Tax=Caenorhabditis bovis TaxID=2654633 RepID=A0A8S1EZW2_9PELO|nr:unnamed protein product [Caenorhabditis bovis]